jgi:hypothetical protein
MISMDMSPLAVAADYACPIGPRQSVHLPVQMHPVHVHPDKVEQQRGLTVA